MFAAGLLAAAAIGIAVAGLAAVAVGEKVHVFGGGPQPGLTVSGANEILSSIGQ